MLEHGILESFWNVFFVCFLLRAENLLERFLVPNFQIIEHGPLAVSYSAFFILTQAMHENCLL